MFYGWVIVAGVFLAQLFMVGIWTYGFPLLVDPVQKEFGASVTEVQLGLGIGGVLGAVTAPLLGPLVDRWSARGMILIGSFMLVMALLFMSISQSVYQFAAVLAILLNGANLLLGPITGSTLVSRWFAASRGLALGIAATGTSIGGLIVPLLLSGWIESMGWRGALQMLAGCVSVLVVPMVIFGLRDHPSDKGLNPDGAASTPDTTGAVPIDRPWTTSEILRSPSFWLIGCSLGLLFMAYTGVLANLHKYATELGVEVPAATRLITTIAIAGFVGKLLFGWAADRLGLRPGLWLAQALAAFGIAILSVEPSYAAMLLACTLMGLAAGGMLPVWGGMVAAAFGIASFGRVMGLLMPVIAIFTSPAPIIAAQSLDRTQSYGLAMQGFVAALMVAAMLLIPLRLSAREAVPELA